MRRASFVIAFLATVALAVLVWPTRYHYETVPFGSQEHYVRFDRFTGEPHRLTSTGWRAMAPTTLSSRRPGGVGDSISANRDPAARIEAWMARRDSIPSLP